MTRALAALLLVALPAFARLEIPVAPLTFGAVPVERPPAIASDGTNAFAVWTDTREGNERTMYGARLGPSGELLDPVGVRLTDGFGAPAVAFGDGRYFAIDATLRFAIVDRDANVLVRGRILEEVAETVRVIFNGRDFVAIWGLDSLRVALVGTDGAIVAAPSTFLGPSSEQRLRDVATNGSRIVALYARGVNLYTASLSMTGAPLATDTLVRESVWPYTPSLASARGTFAASWVPLDGALTVFATPLDGEGRPSGEHVLLANGGAPRLIALDGAIRLLTLDATAPYARLVSRTLAADLTPGPVVPLLAHPPLSLGFFDAVAMRSAVLAIVNVSDPNKAVAEAGLYAATEDAPLAPKLVSRAGMTQRDPAIAAGADGTLVVWRETPDARTKATFFAHAGASSTFDLGGARDHAPAVAAAGDTYLAGWSDGERTYVRLVRDGAPVGDAIVLDTLALPLAIASDGRDFFVAWPRYSVSELRLVRISSAGQLLLETTVPYTSVTSVPFPSLACDRGECLLLWRNQIATWLCPRFGCMRIDSTMVAMRFDTALRPRDAQPIVVGDDLFTDRDQSAAAHDGAYAVAWQINGRVQARTIARDGTLSPLAELEGIRPALARQGDTWLLARELREEIAIARLRDDGRVLGSEGTLFRDGQARRAPAVVASGADVLVVYERTTRDEAAGGVPRVFLTGVNPPVAKRRAARH